MVLKIFKESGQVDIFRCFFCGAVIWTVDMTFTCACCGRRRSEDPYEQKTFPSPAWHRVHRFYRRN